MSKAYKKCFESIQINSVKVKNRIVMAPMTSCFGGPNNEVTDQAVVYYGARARGGTGMIISEGIFVSPEAIQIPCSMALYDDKFAPGLAKIADLIRQNGGVSVMQLIHSGVQAWVPQTVGPSTVGRIMGKPISTELPPKALTIEEIDKILEDFSNAALYAKIGGWDMIQVHGTHGYLVHQFLSSLTNKRTDKYGQDRDLFALQVVEKIREKCGSNYPIIFRLNADEALGDPRLEDGITLEDAKKTAKRLEAAGVDAFDVTGGQDDCIDQYVPSMYVIRDKEGCFFNLASEIKKVVSVPVISGGGVETPEAAEKAIEDGLVDMVFLGRQLIADPDWAIKAEEGRADDIRPCTTCLHCGRIVAYKPINCMVNPVAGFEYMLMSEDDLPPAKTKKKIMVVGAGPGGMECARIAAKRGHQVTLVERNDKTGGTVNTAVIPDFKHKYRKWLEWYDAQMKKMDIDLRLNTEADSDLLQELDPDIVVVATGSKPLSEATFSGFADAVTADDVLLGKAKVGKTVAVIGFGMVGAEVALFLGEKGIKVTVIEALAEPPILGDLATVALIKPEIGLFAKTGVELLLGTKVEEVKGNEIVCADSGTDCRTIQIDTIINATGRESVIPNDLLAKAKELGKEVSVLGDAKAPRKIANAVEEGFTLASRF